MPTPFSRSMRSLELDSFRTTLMMLSIAAILLLGWMAWFLFAEISLYAVTDTASLEVGIVVAEFAPPEALGRVRPEQHGQLRLEGFPREGNGTVRATVARVANEIRNGTIRVELDVVDAPDFPRSLQHGLPGTLEIEVGKVSPANLVLRAIGRTLSGPANESDPPR